LEQPANISVLPLKGTKTRELGFKFNPLKYETMSGLGINW
jgi:hypothetical protein